LSYNKIPTVQAFQETIFKHHIGGFMNLKKRIAKEWLWFLGSIAGAFLLWGVLGLYKPPLVETDVQPVQRTVHPDVTTDSSLERRLTREAREDLKIQVQRLIDAGVPEPEIKKFIKKFVKGQETESSLDLSKVQPVRRWNAPIDPNDIKWDDPSSDATKKWKELRIIFAVLLVPFLYFMRITVWSFKQIRKKPK
jgi:hypothetical protein